MNLFGGLTAQGQRRRHVRYERNGPNTWRSLDIRECVMREPNPKCEICGAPTAFIRCPWCRDREPPK